MGTLQEHNKKRTFALELAMVAIEGAFGETLPVSEIRLERLSPDLWSVVHPAWRLHHDRLHLNIDFNWLRQRNKRRDKLDVSIWCGDKLCGLFLAKLSRKRVNVALRYLESSPFNHPLQDNMISLGLIIAESFARSYGAHTVMVSQPAKGLVWRYREAGYELTDVDLSREKRGHKYRAKVLIKRM
ncbi:hypothetical protein QU24_04530 [Pantoea rodasii]|uniref:N-acetyltransferase domain-containing protein n=1 Tax=Pantoea rodasii TaxID=1076549 RepID=A0A0B1RCB0_9GAMM|nr:hypothetical protein [Pantoea rodasii]KHJ69306.1 hypothetical protein QU24_04530 [Pantoea rodasii]